MEIQFTERDTAIIKALDCASVRFLNEDELVDVLHQRMGKSPSEARALIESYTHPVTHS